eukprot:scaffold1123_cov168-Amphora_coffeaeformis.AAC.27
MALELSAPEVFPRTAYVVPLVDGRHYGTHHNYITSSCSSAEHFGWDRYIAVEISGSKSKSGSGIAAPSTRGRGVHDDANLQVTKEDAKCMSDQKLVPREVQCIFKNFIPPIPHGVKELPWYDARILFSCSTMFIYTLSRPAIRFPTLLFYTSHDVRLSYLQFQCTGGRRRRGDMEKGENSKFQ